MAIHSMVSNRPYLLLTMLLPPFRSLITLTFSTATRFIGFVGLLLRR
jgi:hypothetical protein